LLKVKTGHMPRFYYLPLPVPPMLAGVLDRGVVSLPGKVC